MELEEIGRKLVEALALQGQVGGLARKIADCSSDLAKIDREIDAVLEDKRKAELSLAETRDRLALRKQELEKATEAVVRAEAAHKEAGNVVAAAHSELAEAVRRVELLDDTKELIASSKVEVEAKRADLLRQHGSLRENLASRKKELADYGISLDLAAAPPVHSVL